MSRIKPLLIRTAALAALAGPAAPSSAVDDRAVDPAADPADLARVRAHEQARVEVIRRAAPAVVCVFPRGERFGGGSGVIISPDGYALTNFHVVAGMIGPRVGDAGMSDGTICPFEVLGIDPTGDVAVIQLQRREPLPFAPLGDSDALAVGDPTLAMGNPFLLAEDFTPTVTLGIVSGLHRYQAGVGRALRYTDCIQVDTSINPGNSGGPLFDLAGRVVGINGRVSVEERGRVNVGVGYAISINQIKRFLPALRAGIATKHATAGFTVADRGGRVIIDQIIDDSPAYRTGLRLGDEVRQFGGKPVGSANQFASLLGVYPGRWPVEIVYRRDDRVHRIRCRLEQLPLPKPTGRTPPGAPPPPDPYAAHPITDAANRRAVNRTFARFHEALGGAEAVAAVKSIRAAGRRTLANRPVDEAEIVRLDETRPPPEGAAPPAEPAELERFIRWSLLSAGEDPASSGYRVAGGDEVRGRVAVVIRRRMPDSGPDFRARFDDEDGRLLGIEFEEAATGKRVRYEYDDYRRVGRMKLPHRRWVILDDEPYAEDVFESVDVSSQASP